MKRSSAEEKDLNEQNAKRAITHQITKNRDLHLGEKKLTEIPE